MSDQNLSKMEARLEQRKNPVRQLNGSEHRTENRRHIEETSFITHQKKLLKSTVVDISAHGVGLICGQELQIADYVDLTISQKDAEFVMPIKMRLVIKNCLPTEDSNEFRIGAHIQNPPSIFLQLFDLNEVSKFDEHHTAENYAKRIGITIHSKSDSKDSEK